MEQEYVATLSYDQATLTLTELVFLNMKPLVQQDGSVQTPVILLSDDLKCDESENRVLTSKELTNDQEASEIEKEIKIIISHSKIDSADNDISSGQIFVSKENAETTESEIGDSTSPDGNQNSLGEKKMLSCPFDDCNRTFLYRTHLQYHTLTHTGNRKYKCPFRKCPKSFYTQQRLDVHLRSHTGEKPFTCSVEDCSAKFTTAGNLKNHQRIHSREKPFSCNATGCGKRFSELSSLKKHCLVHTGLKPFECDVCGNKFSQISSRNVHRRRHPPNPSGVLDSQIGKSDHLSRPAAKIIVADDYSTNICRTEIDTTFISDDGLVETIIVPVGMDEDQIVTVDVYPESNAEYDDASNEIDVDGVINQPNETGTVSGNSDQLVPPNAHANVVVLAQPITNLGYH